MNKEEIIEDLIHIYSGGRVPEYYNDNQGSIAIQSVRDWEELPCDPEGATPEQSKGMDSFLDKVAREIETAQ